MNRDDEESQRFIAEPVLGRKRFFATLRVTGSEGLRMTRTEGLSMAEELLDELIKVLRSHRSQKIGL